MILHRLARWLSGSHDLLKWGAAGLFVGWSAFATAIAAIVDSKTGGAAVALVILSVGLGVALLILSVEWLWRVEERAMAKGAEREERIAAKERVLGIGDKDAGRVHSMSRRKRPLARRPTGTSRLVGRTTIDASHRRIAARGSSAPPST